MEVKGLLHALVTFLLSKGPPVVLIGWKVLWGLEWSGCGGKQTYSTPVRGVTLAI